MKTDDQEFYQKIGELLWSVMPIEANELIIYGQIYDQHQSFRFTVEREGSIESLSLDREIRVQLRTLIEGLQKCEIYAKEPWTQFKITLSNEGKFIINFAYILEEDSWPRIYMKGISDLSEDEWQETSIPKELWEERVRLKKQS